jgi:hypothetical protein
MSGKREGKKNKRAEEKGMVRKRKTMLMKN